MIVVYRPASGFLQAPGTSVLRGVRGNALFKASERHQMDGASYLLSMRNGRVSRKPISHETFRRFSKEGLIGRALQKLYRELERLENRVGPS
jgi:hypothetical protein